MEPDRRRYTSSLKSILNFYILIFRHNSDGGKSGNNNLEGESYVLSFQRFHRSHSEYIPWRDNSCHIDCLIVCLSPFFRRRVDSQYHPNSLERRMFLLAEKLEDETIKREQLALERHNLWQWAVDQGFPIEIGEMAEIDDWLDFLASQVCRSSDFNRFVHYNLSCAEHGKHTSQYERNCYSLTPALLKSTDYNEIQAFEVVQVDSSVSICSNSIGADARRLHSMPAALWKAPKAEGSLRQAM